MNPIRGRLAGNRSVGRWEHPSLSTPYSKTWVQLQRHGVDHEPYIMLFSPVVYREGESNFERGTRLRLYQKNVGHWKCRRRSSKIAPSFTPLHQHFTPAITVPPLTAQWLRPRSFVPSTEHFYANYRLVHYQKSLDHRCKLAFEVRSPPSQKLQSNKPTSFFSMSKHKECTRHY